MKGFTTKAIHTGYTPSADDGAVIPPIHLATTFRAMNGGGYDYSRSGNPTRAILEATIAALDGNRYGLAYASGSAVLANVVAFLSAGQKIVFSTDAYGGTYRFIVNVAGKQGIGYTIVDFTDIRSVELVLKNGDVGVVWVETPTNPLLKVVDIGLLAALAKRYKALLVVDNTFATPILQQPARLGADIVVYSTTKYINGHSDVVGGALTVHDEELYKRFKFLQNAIGAILSPFDSWLTLRGLRTLELRMERHCDNAEHIASFLLTHPKVKQVYYPGFFTGEQNKIVTKQMRRPGAMLSFELKDGGDNTAFISHLRLIPLAESLGGVESLIDHPATMTHAAIPPEERYRIGLSDSLFRLSVGIENIDDLVSDLTLALDAV